MKQKLLKLMCLLCVSMMGVSAWGESEVVILSEDFSSITTGNSTGTTGSSTSWTDDNDNFPKASRISAYKAGGAVKLGGKSSVGSLTTKSLNLSGNGGKYIVQFDVKGWSSVEGSIKVTSSNGDEETVSYTATMNDNFETKSVSFDDGTASTTITIATTAKRAFIDNVKIYYVDGETPSTPTCEAPTFSVAEGAYTTAQSVTLSTTTDGATIYYTTNGDEPTTSSSVYSSAISVSTTTTIKAIAVKDGYVNSGVASASYTIYTPTTFNKVTNMNQLVAGNEYIIVYEESATSGIAMGAQSGTLRTCEDVTISANSVIVDPTSVAVLTLGGSTDAWTFLASDNNLYLAWTSGNNLNTSDDDTKTSAQWIVTDDFTLKNKSDQTRVLQYNSSSPRFACYTSSQKSAYLYVKAGSSVGKNVADVAISTTALYVDGTATVTTDGPAVTLSTSDASVASVSGTTVTAEGTGTATITATWDESAEFQAGSKEFTITVLRVDGLSSAKAFTVAEAKAMIDNGYDSDATYYVDGIISKIDSYNDSHHSITYWISEDGSTTDQFECYGGLSFDGEGFTGKDNLTVGDEVTVKGKLNKYGSTYELNSNNELVYLRSTISVSASGYATYYNSGLAYVIPTGLTGYAITAAAGDQLTTTEYTAGFGVPAGEALVLKGAQGNYDLIFTTTDVTPNASNLLKGSDAAETPTADGKYYMLSYDATGANVGFYWGEDNGAAFENGAHKAYLLLPSATPVKGFRFDFDEATAITELTEKTEVTEGVIYNLQGQRMNSLQRGINIVGGKKVLVK